MRPLLTRFPRFSAQQTFWIFLLLTLITTTLAGSEWVGNVSVLSSERPLTLEAFWKGFHFSVPFLFVLTCHEFAHYWAAKIHKVSATLPFYIPLWLGFLAAPSIGTLGAFIKIKSPIYTRRQFFDIGISGPIAGFLVALILLYYGFRHLPPADYIFALHPEYIPHGLDYPQYVYTKAEDFALGSNLLFFFFQHHVAASEAYIPPPQEWVHYPYIFAGFLALFFTALNLFPIGQLDGGHVLYGLFGRTWHRRISYAATLALIFYAGLGFVQPRAPLYDIFIGSAVYGTILYFSLHFVKNKRKKWLLLLFIFCTQYGLTYLYPEASGYQGWLLFSLLVGRFLGVEHPPAQQEAPLNTARKVLGWAVLFVFVLCFTPRPFVMK